MKIVKLFDDFLDINASMLGMSRQEYTSRYLSEMVEYTSDELSKIWDSKYGEDLKSEHSGFFNKISKSASTKKEIVEYWDSIYGEDLKSDYGAFYDALTESNEGSINEGQFSWMTYDTDKQIGSEKQNTIDVYMYDNEGNQWYEKGYDGYGEFGNMDYYELLAKMNGFSEEDLDDKLLLKSIRAMGKAEMRDIGIALAFDPKGKKIKTRAEGGEVLFPALVEDPKFNWKRHDFRQEAESDENQSWYQEPDYDEDDEDDEDYENGWYESNNEFPTFNEYLNEGKFDNLIDLTKSLHFEMDPKTAEEMKIELGKRQGEVSKRKQIEGGEYSLRRFRKEIGYWDGNKRDQEWAEDVFAGPEHYNTVKSTLGAGPHAKKVKKVKWNQRKYDKWISDLAYDNDGAGQDSSYGYEMAQNAKHEPGLIDWVTKSFRSDDVLQRIQWDIEAAMESVVNEEVVYNSSNTKPEAAKKATKEFGKLLPKANKGIQPYKFAVVKTKAKNYRLAIKSGSYVAHEFMTNLKDDGILTADIVKAAVANVIKLNPDEFNEAVNIASDFKQFVLEKNSALTERFNFSKKEVEMAANLIASAISQNDRVKAKVHDLEYDKGRGAGFEISIDGEKYEGGSYVVRDNGDVVNAAIGNSHPNAVYNTIGNKDIADVFINMEKYEAVSFNEATVIMDAMDPGSKILKKLLKKHKVTMKIIDNEGPSGWPEVELTGDRKDLKKVLASEDGWDDEDLAEYIEESNEGKATIVTEARQAPAKTLFKMIVKGSTSEIEGVKISSAMAQAALDWFDRSTYARKYEKQVKTAGMGAVAPLIFGDNWGIKKTIPSKLKAEFKELQAQYKKVMPENESLVTEAKLTRGLKPLLTIGSTITKKAGEDALLDLSDKFDRIDDEYAGTIASWLDMAIELMQDGYSGDATKKLKQFNKACKDVLNGKEVGSAFESVVNESDKTPTMLLADEIEGAEFHHGFGDGVEVEARSTKKTWEDGVPVLKYIARAPKKTVKMPKGRFEVVIDDKFGWIYWQDKGVWYGMDKEDDYIPFEF